MSKERERRVFTDGLLCLSGRGVTRVFGLGEKKTVAVDHVDFDFHEGGVCLHRGGVRQREDNAEQNAAGPSQSHGGGDPLPGQAPRHRKRPEKAGVLEGHPGHFQDPFSSFNVFHKNDSVLLDCINMRGGRNLSKEEKVRLMTEACSFVNLKFAELTNKYPFELSGGQMQRLMIARIFLLKPKILLADEVILHPHAAYTKRLISDAPKIHEE